MRLVAKLVSGAVACTPLAMALVNGLSQLWQIPGASAPGLELALGPGASPLSWGLLASLLVGCIALVFRLPSVEPQKRVAWVVFLILFSVVAIPVFWYSHIYQSQPAPASSSEL